MTTTSLDLIGMPVSTEEQALLDVYAQLKALAVTDLPPCADSNVKEALSSVAIAVTDLGLVFEHLTDYGC